MKNNILTSEDFISYVSTPQVSFLSTNQIALEDGFIKNIKDKIYTFTTGISDKINTRTHGLKGFLYERGSIAEVKELNTFYKKFDKLTKDKTFEDLEFIQIPTIIGLEAPLVTLVKLNSRYFVDLRKNAFKYLDTIDTLIADFIGDSESRKSFKDRTKEIISLDNEFNIKLQEELAGIFNVRNKEEFINYGKMVRSKNELKEILHVVGIINETFSDKDLIKLNKEIVGIVKRIDSLIKLISMNEDDISKEALVNVVSALEVLSNYITSISNLYYIHVRTMDVLTKIRKDIF